MIVLEYEMTYAETIEGLLGPTAGSPLGERLCWQVTTATLRGPRITAASSMPGTDWIRLGAAGGRTGAANRRCSPHSPTSSSASKAADDQHPEPSSRDLIRHRTHCQAIMRRIRHVRALTGLDEQSTRAALASFGVRSEIAARPLATLSPGERTRTALTAIAARRARCLLLDGGSARSYASTARSACSRELIRPECV